MVSPIRPLPASNRPDTLAAPSRSRVGQPIRFQGNPFNDAFGWFKKQAADILDVDMETATQAKVPDEEKQKPDEPGTASGWSLEGILETVITQSEVVKDKATEVFRGASTLEDRVNLWSREVPNELAEKGQFDKAFQSFQKAIQLEPGNAVLQVRLGDFCRKWGKLQLMWKHGIKLSDQSEAVVQGLSQTQVSFLQEAKQAYRQALTLGCEKPDQVKQFLSRTLQLNHEWQEAIAVLEDLHRASPENNQVLIELGNIYQETNQIDKAIAAYETVMKQDKALTADVPYRLGLIQEQLAQQAPAAEATTHRVKALDFYMKATSAEPSDVKVHINLGDKLRENNLSTMALGEYQRALDQIKELRKLGEAMLKEYGISLDVMDVHKAQDRIDQIRAERKKSGRILLD